MSVSALMCVHSQQILDVSDFARTERGFRNAPERSLRSMIHASTECVYSFSAQKMLRVLILRRAETATRARLCGANSLCGRHQSDGQHHHIPILGQADTAYLLAGVELEGIGASVERAAVL